MPPERRLVQSDAAAPKSMFRNIISPLLVDFVASLCVAIAIFETMRLKSEQYQWPPSRYAARISGRASNSAPVPAIVMTPLTKT